ncbi:MAG: citrate/2-methylcitrate synthase, partial [Endozoicomonas sp.]
LTYRGYDIRVLADKAQFEEIAYLLLYGNLPNQAELDEYKIRLQGMRSLPNALKTVLEHIPAEAHPMDVMRTGCSVLGNLETEKDFSEQLDHIDRMLAIFPGMINYWYNFSHNGIRVNVDTDADSIAEQFLWTLHDKKPEPLHVKVMHASLILYAEHEFNASTFTGRVCASTLSDIHSCITAAIGSLRGPLHGGANEAAMEMIENWHSADEAEDEIMDMLARKDKIMGFGHAIYRESDPRNAIIKEWSQKLSEQVGDECLYEISERVESVMWREK